MPNNKNFVRYERFKNRIIFPERLAAGTLPQFAGAIQIWKDRRPDNRLILDFSKVTKAFANGMLGIIAAATDLRLQGNKISIIAPELPIAGKFFTITNWAHLLDPANFSKISQKHRRQFLTQFSTYSDLPALINGFMDIIMRHMEMPGDILAGLEWSVKLYLQLGKERFEKIIKHLAIQPLVAQLIDKAIAERMDYPGEDKQAK